MTTIVNKRTRQTNKPKKKPCIRKKLFELLFTLKINTVQVNSYTHVWRPVALHIYHHSSEHSLTIIIQSFFCAVHFRIEINFLNVCCCLHFVAESGQKECRKALVENLFFVCFFFPLLFVCQWQFYD